MLFDYTVDLIEEDFVGFVDRDEYSILFECTAEDFDHAVQQALNAYPGAELLEVIRGEAQSLFVSK